jgi:hypothetical protein
MTEAKPKVSLDDQHSCWHTGSQYGTSNRREVGAATDSVVLTTLTLQQKRDLSHSLKND